MKSLHYRLDYAPRDTQGLPNFRNNSLLQLDETTCSERHGT